MGGSLKKKHRKASRTSKRKRGGAVATGGGHTEQEGGFFEGVTRAYKAFWRYDRGSTQRSKLTAAQKEIEAMKAQGADKSSLQSLSDEYESLEKSVAKYSSMSKQLETLREANKDGLAKLAVMINEEKAKMAAKQGAPAEGKPVGEEPSKDKSEPASMESVEKDSQILPSQPATSDSPVPVTDTKEKEVDDVPSQRTPGTETYSASGGRRTRRRRKSGRKKSGTRRQKGGFKKAVAFVGEPWSGGNTSTWGKTNYYAKNDNVVTDPSPAR